MYVRVARLTRTALVFHQEAKAAAAKAAEGMAAAEAKALSAHKHARAIVRESVTMGTVDSLTILASLTRLPNTVTLRLTCSILSFFFSSFCAAQCTPYKPTASLRLCSAAHPRAHTHLSLTQSLCTVAFLAQAAKAAAWQAWEVWHTYI